PFDQILLLTTQDDYSAFSNNVSKLFKRYPFNTSDNLLAFESNYESLLEDFITYPLDINLTRNLNETSLHTRVFRGSFTIVGVIEQWNFAQILNDSHLIEKTILDVKITSSRFTLLTFGLGSIFAGIGITILSARVKKMK
ncbi:MAG: hypothetical protein ACFE8U_18420, partial [Candidatus Hermodarchaeota archaeon]